MNRWIVLLAVACVFARTAGPGLVLGLDAAEPGEYVVLLHGMGRTAFSMLKMEWALSKQGYRVINVSYPSTCQSIESLSDQWLATLLRTRVPDSVAKVHFVTHSLGGIVVRQYLADHEMENLGRVVMLGPPNQGSEVAERLRGNFLYRLTTGPAGQELGTGASSVPCRLPPATFEVGVIAGDRSSNWVLSRCIPGSDDGKVVVERTRLEGMQDFLLVHHSHTWIMCRKDVIAAVSQFLKKGRFAADPDLPSGP